MCTKDQLGISNEASADSHPLLSVIIPCFNEEANIDQLSKEIVKHCEAVSFEIVFVDDGSTDNSLESIKQVSLGDKRIRWLSFVKNSGHQAAIRAGLRAARGQFLVTLDADLQHPPQLIPRMLERAREGYDIVSMVRTGGQQGVLKNLFSKGFYWFFNRISHTPIPPNVSDFRLISRRVAVVLNSLPERRIVLRALLPALGFKTALMEFDLGRRFKGSHSYTLTKSVDLAYKSIFNFTTFPLDLGFRVGLLVSFLAFGYGLFAIYVHFFTSSTVPGWTGLICTISFLGGFTLIYIGIIGKYIEVILDYLKKQPEYIIGDSREQGESTQGL